MADTTLAISNAFYQDFSTRKSDLLARLSATRSSPSSSTTLAPDLASLRKAFTDVADQLPGYDRRLYETQLKELEAELAVLNAESRPKTKFAFKKRAAAPSSSPAPTNITPSPSRATAPAPAPSSHLSLSSQSSAYLTLPPNAAPSDLTLSCLTSCIVNLTNLQLSALHAKDLTRCVVLAPLVGGSVMLHGLRECVVLVGCHQFRMHSSSRTQVHLFVSSHPIIEHSTSIRFSPYPLAHPLSFNPSSSLHTEVQDFDWLRPEPSPNWRAVPGGQRDWGPLLAREEGEGEGWKERMEEVLRKEL